MATHKFDLAVKVGEYEKHGEKKNRYRTIGKVMEGERGQYILLDKLFLSPQLLMLMAPDAANDSIMAWMNEPYGKKEATKAAKEESSDVPF